jgi:Family of unknown function (DUF5317)
MTLALAFLLIVMTVPLAGGRLSRLGELRLRSIWLAFLAFAIQIVIVTVVPDGDTTAHRAAHLVSYALVAACILRNLHLRFAWVVALGGLLNLIAIVANGGVMPASRSALETAGLDARSGEFANSDVVEGANVAFLGDVFAIPDGWPGANVFSVGDALMVVGAFLLLHAATGSRLVRSDARERAARPSGALPPRDQAQDEGGAARRDRLEVAQVLHPVAVGTQNGEMHVERRGRAGIEAHGVHADPADAPPLE